MVSGRALCFGNFDIVGVILAYLDQAVLPDADRFMPVPVPRFNAPPAELGERVQANLLELLATNPGRAYSRSEILHQVWGYRLSQYSDTRVVDVHISRLRSKLEDDPSAPELILTARGTGYMFQNYSSGVPAPAAAPSTETIVG